MRISDWSSDVCSSDLSCCWCCCCCWWWCCRWGACCRCSCCWCCSWSSMCSGRVGRGLVVHRCCRFGCTQYISIIPEFLKGGKVQFNCYLVRLMLPLGQMLQVQMLLLLLLEIGIASCRERVCRYV